MKKYNFLILIILICLGLNSCKKEFITTDIGGSILSNKKAITLSVGEKTKIGVLYNQKSTAGEKLTWSSLSPQVASVTGNSDNTALVTALAVGTAKLVVQSSAKMMADTCFVTVTNENVLNVLVIGNSASEDAVEAYLYDLAKAAGKKLVIGNLVSGEAGLAQHLKNALGNMGAYEYRKIGLDGVRRSFGGKTIYDALNDENWDIISFQEATHLAGVIDGYKSSLSALMSDVKKWQTNPDVKYIMHETWAFAKNSQHAGFELYNKDQNQMFNAIITNVWQGAALGNITTIVPVGTAIQNGRTSYLRDNFTTSTSKGTNLNNAGRYIAAATWFETLFGLNVRDNTFKATGFSNKEDSLAKAAAHFAVLTPQQITVLTDFQKGEERDITDMGTFSVTHDNPNGPYDGEGSLKLVDGNTGTKFLARDLGSKMAEGFGFNLTFADPIVVNAYTFTSGNDAPERDPKNWVFQASNDNITWVTLDTRVNEEFSGRSMTRRFDISNNDPYKHYRIRITALIDSSPNPGLFQQSEWRLRGY